MPLSQAITETIILRTKNLPNTVEGGPTFDSIFFRLVHTVKGQPGFIRQYWGNQVEDPTVFLWSIDWESIEDQIAFEKSNHYGSIKKGLSNAFNIEEFPPLLIYTKFDHDPIPAIEAPVTEVAFYTVPSGTPEETKREIDAIFAKVPVMEGVTKIGKSTGGATGWVSKTDPQNGGAREGHTIAYHGVFGYASIEDHMRWRDTPEHAQVIEGLSELGKFEFEDSDIFGKTMFHVRFQKGN
ncbi:hypothetical protein BGZ60DRAFT_419968 [Tricladium varicosporioides]|nr:hypothetical protein BGZ60DRAFT_419968 [Hymenoscyphus varicosporioides]